MRIGGSTAEISLRTPMTNQMVDMNAAGKQVLNFEFDRTIATLISHDSPDGQPCLRWSSADDQYKTIRLNGSVEEWLPGGVIYISFHHEDHEGHADGVNDSGSHLIKAQLFSIDGLKKAGWKTIICGAETSIEGGLAKIEGLEIVDKYDGSYYIVNYGPYLKESYLKGAKGMYHSVIFPLTGTDADEYILFRIAVPFCQTDINQFGKIRDACIKYWDAHIGIL